jgi:hypothetical protein
MLLQKSGLPIKTGGTPDTLITRPFHLKNIVSSLENILFGSMFLDRPEAAT